MNDTRELYLDLMKKCLINMIYGKDEVGASFIPSKIIEKWLSNFFYFFGLRLVNIKTFNPNLRRAGKDWPITAHTMIGLRRLNNIQFCIEKLLENRIPGDFIEAGVWRGGATIFMRAVLKAYQIKNRTVWVADSFTGLPVPNSKKYPHDIGSDLHKVQYLAVSLDEVKDNFRSYGLLDNQVHFLKGWFKNTLPNSAIKQLSLIRIDADMYESTLDALINLYPKLSKGGYVIIDDYRILPACRQATNNFRQQQKINDKIIPIDYSAIFWQRSQ